MRLVQRLKDTKSSNHTTTQTDCITPLHPNATCPAPCLLIAILYSLLSCLMGFGQICASVPFFNEVGVTGTIGSWLGREVWRITSRTTGICADLYIYMSCISSMAYWRSNLGVWGGAKLAPTIEILKLCLRYATSIC